MYSLNRAELIGNLTRDPEMKYIPSGQAVTSFSIATNRRWKDKDGNNQEQTEFHDVVAWGKLAEIMTQILHKGNKVYVDGRLQTRQWDAQDGSKRSRTEIVVNDFVVLSPKGEAATTNHDSSAPTIEEYPGDDNAPAEKPGKEDKKPFDAAQGRPAPKPADDEEINLDEIPF